MSELSLDQQSEIWGTLYAVGAEWPDAYKIKTDALDWLTMRGYVEQSVEGPKLTSKGQAAYKVMESGKGVVSELDGVDLEV